MTKRLLSTQRIVNLSSNPTSATAGEVYYNTVSNELRVYDGTTWVAVGSGGSSGYPQPSEPTLPTTGTVWVDTDDISPNYPQFPTVIYSPTDPSASLTVADVGTIWIDQTIPTMSETVVPAVLYQAASPTNLGINDVGYVWIDSDENIIEYNMNDYLTKAEAGTIESGFNPFLLAGM